MNTSSSDQLAPGQVLATWHQLHGDHAVTRTLVSLREALPDHAITAKVHYGVTVDGSRSRSTATPVSISR